jgi:hypothetical protein
LETVFYGIEHLIWVGTSMPWNIVDWDASIQKLICLASFVDEKKI